MSSVRETARRIAASGRLPHPYGNDRQLELEKLARKLGDREKGQAREGEAWDDFLLRIGVIQEGAE